MEAPLLASDKTSGRAPFPHDFEEFTNDDRVSYSQLDGCWILEEADGSVWEFNERLKKWMLMQDEELRKQQAAAYAVDGVDEAEPAQPAKKRKKSENDAWPMKQRKMENTAPTQPRKNTSVFVTNIPLDATKEEVVEVFSKYGLIAESLDTGEKRVKLYTNDDGKFKGEALVTYFREESVPLAIQMLDDYDFRLGKPNPDGTVKVSKADFSYKSTNESQSNSSNAAKEKSERDKLRGKNKFLKMNKKLADWDDDDPQDEPPNRFEKIVIMKHMFTPSEIQEDITLLLDIPAEIREECEEKYGEVSNVVIYDKEPEGVVTVRFFNAEDAQACVKATNGRFFAGRTVEAYISKGREHFRKSHHRGPKTEEEEREEEERLERFGQSLET